MIQKYREVVDLKREFKKRWRGWIDSIEPSLGSGIGVPDLLVLLPHRGLMHLLPVELKVGTLRNGRIRPDLVRGSQVRWHFHLNDMGGKSAMVVGISNDEAYLIDGRDVIGWKIGFEIKKACRIFYDCETNLFLDEMFQDFFRTRMKPNPYELEEK